MEDEREDPPATDAVACVTVVLEGMAAEEEDEEDEEEGEAGVACAKTSPL